MSEGAALNTDSVNRPQSAAGANARPQVLLLTATIAPRPDTFSLTRSDPAARLADYRAAFAHYLGLVAADPAVHIVLVENSGAPIDEFEAAARAQGLDDRVEVLGYTANDDSSFSRFFLEARLLTWALDHSRLLTLPNAVIWKITGRYIVANLSAIIRRQPARFDVYLNFRDYPEPVIDFYVAGFTLKGLKAVIDPARIDYRTTRSGELILREKIDDGHFDELAVTKRFTVVPDVRGYRGFDNRKYHGLKQRAKFAARVLANRLMPQVWI
ncbi:MAG: hypothetical protein AAFY19_00905 [Pseudomonadota bacterium]